MTQHSKRSQPARENQPAELHEDSTNIHKPKGAVAGIPAACQILSDREFEVFMLLAKGHTVAKIAEQLSLSPRTVGTHLYNIKQKLNAENSAEITLTALRSGLLEH